MLAYDNGIDRVTQQ